MRLYLVRGARRTNGAAETVTKVLRQGPAAERCAQRWEAIGRGPVTIVTTLVPEANWSEVPR